MCVYRIQEQRKEEKPITSAELERPKHLAKRFHTIAIPVPLPIPRPVHSRDKTRRLVRYMDSFPPEDISHIDSDASGRFAEIMMVAVTVAGDLLVHLASLTHSLTQFAASHSSNTYDRLRLATSMSSISPHVAAALGSDSAPDLVKVAAAAAPRAVKWPNGSASPPSEL